jgi:CheY-like chemotaxis protein
VRILVVEDDLRLAEVLRRGLTESGHYVNVEHDGARGQSSAVAGDHDAIVLDVMLPRRDGLSVVREIRKRGIRTPVLLLTSRDTVDDTIAGLDAGADDYLRKPFVFRELDARLRSITRRSDAPRKRELSVAGVTLDLRSFSVRRDGFPIALTARETVGGDVIDVSPAGIAINGRRWPASRRRLFTRDGQRITRWMSYGRTRLGSSRVLVVGTHPNSWDTAACGPTSPRRASAPAGSRSPTLPLTNSNVDYAAHDRHNVWHRRHRDGRYSVAADREALLSSPTATPGVTEVSEGRRLSAWKIMACGRRRRRRGRLPLRRQRPY